MKCIEYLYFATLLFWVNVYENVTLCIQNRMLQKWWLESLLWELQHSSMEVKTYTAQSHHFDPPFIFSPILIPVRWGCRKQNLLLMRWYIVTSHLELTDIFIAFLKAIYVGRTELDWNVNHLDFVFFFFFLKILPYCWNFILNRLWFSPPLICTVSNEYSLVN